MCILNLSYPVALPPPSLSFPCDLHVEEPGPFNLWAFHSLDFAAFQCVPLSSVFPAD